jgi:hypothetical protein
LENKDIEYEESIHTMGLQSSKYITIEDNEKHLK